MNKLKIIPAAVRRDKTAITAVPRRSQRLACVWTRDPSTGRAICRWQDTDAGAASTEQPSRFRDRGQPPSRLPLAA
jgi:hypothetical protein